MASKKDFVSAQQVAERAGVSRSAVSRTFTPGASVAPQTRRKVMEAAESLGYHVNQLARGLMLKESGIVCLVVSEIATPYRAVLLRALTQKFQAVGKIAMVINTDRSDDSVGHALEQAIRYRADASVILSGTPNKSIVDLCLRSGQRLVLINRDDDQEGPLRINLNDAEAAERICTAFLRAGCRELAFVNSEAGTASLQAREDGFVEAAAKAGIVARVERHGATVYQSGRILAQRLLTMQKRPDAVFCANDLLACGFMDEARTAFGLSVPEQLCIAGFDDIEQASWGAYELTTFAQPVEAIAERTVEWLQNESNQTNTIRLPAQLVWRRSIRGG